MVKEAHGGNIDNKRSEQTIVKALSDHNAFTSGT
jgi:hypothetical protein